MPMPSKIVANMATKSANIKYSAPPRTNSLPRIVKVETDLSQFKTSMVRMPVKFVKLILTSITATATNKRNYSAMMIPAFDKAVITLLSR